jgi:multiple sugar transport system substrate-binding protein
MSIGLRYPISMKEEILKDQMQKLWQHARRIFLPTMLLLMLLVTACVAPAAAPSAGETASTNTSAEASSGASGDEAVVLRLAWWGDEPRHNMYNDLADMYEELNPGVTIEREFAGWDPYWEKLATQVAGGNAPDIIHTHPNYLYDYANRGALLDLTPLIESGQIDLSKWPAGIIDTGKIDAEIYMLTLGNSSVGMHYNPALFEEAGVAEPEFDWTWSEWMDTVVVLQAGLGEDRYAMSDSGSDARGFRVFLRQRNKLFFEGDELGFEPEDLRDYWQMWEDLRAAGTLPPPALTQETQSLAHADSMLVKGTVAIQVGSGNQHKLYQDYVDHQLGLVPFPHSDNPDDPFGYTVDGAYISISATSDKVDESAAFLNWFLNDPEVARIYNAEHGPPGNADNAAMVRESAEPADQRLADMMAYIAPNAIPQGYQPPTGGEVLDAFVRIYTELSFGTISLDEAVNNFFDEVEFILN